MVKQEDENSVSQKSSNLILLLFPPLWQLNYDLNFFFFRLILSREGASEELEKEECRVCLAMSSNQFRGNPGCVPRPWISLSSKLASDADTAAINRQVLSTWNLSSQCVLLALASDRGNTDSQLGSGKGCLGHAWKGSRKTKVRPDQLSMVTVRWSSWVETCSHLWAVEATSL